MKKLVVIGDSWTYGSEIRNPNLPESINDWDEPNDKYRLPKIWPTKLGKMMGIEEVINLSYPAASNDRSVRHLVGWLTQEYFVKDKPTDDLFVIVGLTSPERKDFYYKDDGQDGHNYWITMWPMWTHNYTQKPLQQFGKIYTEHFWNSEEYIHRYVNQLFYLQTLFKHYKINYLFFQAFYQYKDMHIRQWADDPYARNYQSQPDKMLWNLIDSVRFMNKDKEPHSFHNYIMQKDPTENKSIALLNMHPSELGHTWWAEHLFDYIRENKLW